MEEIRKVEELSLEELEAQVSECLDDRLMMQIANDTTQFSQSAAGVVAANVALLNFIA